MSCSSARKRACMWPRIKHIVGQAPRHRTAACAQLLGARSGPPAVRREPPRAVCAPCCPLSPALSCSPSRPLQTASARRARARDWQRAAQEGPGQALWKEVMRGGRGTGAWRAWAVRAHPRALACAGRSHGATPPQTRCMYGRPGVADFEASATAAHACGGSSGTPHRAARPRASASHRCAGGCVWGVG